MVLDIVLPQLDGWEILGRVKEMRAKDRPTDQSDEDVILSNLDKEEIKRLDSVPTGFMIKAHFTPSEVAEEIEKPLRTPIN